ncbi:MAG: EamA family transporter [Candidatus Delongbacteria bacterium]|nr:EamA family transporter [Candidatus Delongbacteria bacterium]
MLDFMMTLLIFSSMEVCSKPLMHHIDPGVLTFWRFLIGFIIVLAVTFYKKKIRGIVQLNAKQWITLASIGVIGNFFAMTMLQKAVELGSAATVALIFCSNPIFVFFVQFILKEEKLTIKPLAGMSIAVIGIGMILFDKLAIDGSIHFALLASGTFALSTLMNKRVSKTVEPLIMNLVSFFFGLLFLAGYLIFTGFDLQVPSEVISNPVFFTLFLYLGIVVNGIGYITFMRTIKRFTPVSSSVIFLIKPAIASLFSVVILSEIPRMNFLAGLTSIFIGSWLVIRR